jgi:uncharacterized tellurite resistance protein B-like protein
MTASDLSQDSAALFPMSIAKLTTQLTDRIRAWLGGSSAISLDQAVAALLVHTATLGSPASPARRRRMEVLLRDYTRQDEHSVGSLIDAAQRADGSAADIHCFVRVVNRCPPQDRIAVFAMAADIAFADVAGAEEDGFLRLLGGLFGISDHDRGFVQHRARETHSQPSPSTLHKGASYD